LRSIAATCSPIFPPAPSTPAGAAIEAALFSRDEAVEDPEAAMRETVFAYFSFLQRLPLLSGYCFGKT
jgi:hypothetical protein